MRKYIVLLALLIGACSTDPSEPEASLVLTTDRASYLTGDAIRIALSNANDETVFVSHCNFRLLLVLEQRAGSGWNVIDTFNQYCLGIYEAGEIAVDAGAMRTDSLTLDRTGEFRLIIYGREASDDFGDIAVASNAFVVTAR